MRKSKRGAARSLTEIVGFTEDDLAANRKNALSKPQVAVLRRRAGRWLDYYAAILLIGMIADFSIIFLGNRLGEDFGTTALKVMIASVIALLLFANAWLVRGSEMSVINNQTVEVLEGYVHPYIESYRGTAVEHRIEIEDMTFKVSRAVFQAFEPRTYYRIYYAPIFKQILSVEDGHIPLDESYFEDEGRARLDPTTIRPAAKPQTRDKAAP